jgi:hypothetical protein
MATPPVIKPQQVVRVQTAEEMQATTTRYVVQGYSVVTQTPTSVLLIKRKQFNIIWAVIGFFLCLLPLLVYLIYYMTQTDQLVQIELIVPHGSTQAIPPSPGSGDARSASPDAPAQVISPDGTHYWDGQAWQLIET